LDFLAIPAGIVRELADTLWGQRGSVVFMVNWLCAQIAFAQFVKIQNLDFNCANCAKTQLRQIVILICAQVYTTKQNYEQF
jgi:hypothetical protein